MQRLLDHDFARIELCGSLSRGMALKDHPDIDILVVLKDGDGGNSADERLEFCRPKILALGVIPRRVREQNHSLGWHFAVSTDPLQYK